MNKDFKYYDLILGAYVCVLLCANLICPAKISTVHLPLIGSVTFLAGVLFFPIPYLFGDVLTEVYGYARDRRVVWSGFAALVFAPLSVLPQSSAQVPFGTGWFGGWSDACSSSVSRRARPCPSRRPG